MAKRAVILRAYPYVQREKQTVYGPFTLYGHLRAGLSTGNTPSILVVSLPLPASSLCGADSLRSSRQPCLQTCFALSSMHAQCLALWSTPSVSISIYLLRRMCDRLISFASNANTCSVQYFSTVFMYFYIKFQ